ncbi:MAG: hypothetical protein H6633_24510 [Anaerolineales bacterium]|nr:hypothetical protein [Anaerolineales bacterium]
MVTLGRCFTPVSMRDGYDARIDRIAQDTHPFWTGPVNQRWPVHFDDASTTASLVVDHSHLLNGAIASGSPSSVVSSRFCPLLTSRQTGDDAVSRTISAVGLDEVPQIGYHRTNINLQLSKNSEPFFAAHPPVS